MNGQRRNIGLGLIRANVEYDMGGQVTLRNAGGAVITCAFEIDAVSQ